MRGTTVTLRQVDEERLAAIHTYLRRCGIAGERVNRSLAIRYALDFAIAYLKGELFDETDNFIAGAARDCGGIRDGGGRFQRDKRNVGCSLYPRGTSTDCGEQPTQA